MASSLAIIPGAGSAGLTWGAAAGLLGAPVLPVPDRPDVPAMAAALLSEIEELREPRVLLGASLGAMVALELARRARVAGLVLLAAGWGITVGDSFLEWVAQAPPDLFPKMARTSIADRDDLEKLAGAVRDFEARGAAVVHRHLAALGAYRPEPFAEPPPTLVIWGEKDRSVPLADHAELALQMSGMLAPIERAAHKPFYEQPEATVNRIRWWLAAMEL